MDMFSRAFEVKPYSPYSRTKGFCLVCLDAGRYTYWAAICIFVGLTLKYQMEIVLLLIILIVLFMLIRNLSGVHDEVTKLNNELFDLKNLISNKYPAEIKHPEEKTAAAKKPETVLPPPFVEKPEIEIERKPITEPEISQTETVAIQNTETIPSPRPVPDYVLASPTPGWFSKWLQDNPDIEKFIGENLINKIGISILVLGIAFFVKYAIDQEWINKIGRVCIGLLCGVILVWLANRLRKNYHAFSSVLVGGSLTVFYFTIAFAFHQYHLISQGAAFGIMVVITIFAVLISILYDRIELGILATVGGFITPFLVSQGEGNWFALFSYLSILNAGLIVLAYYKRWRVINFIAFFFTQIIYLGWLISKSGSPHFNYTGVFVFGLIFYLMFLVMNIIHHVIRASQLKAFDFIILLSANLCFFGAGIYLIQESGVPQYGGLFTASLGIVNLVLAYLFFKRSGADKKFIYLLIGLTISFISMAAPVQLKGHYITLFWSAEIVVLLWLYQKSFISLLKITVLLVTALMLISLLMDWSFVYAESPLIYPVLFNKGWITGVCSALSLFLVFRLLRKEADLFYIRPVSNQRLRNIYLVGSVILLYTSGALEIYYQFLNRIPDTGLEVIYLQLYSTLFVVVLLTVLPRVQIKIHPVLPVVLSFVVLAMYLLNISLVHGTEQVILFSGNHKAFFTGSWLGAVFLFVLIWNMIQIIRKNPETFSRVLPHLTWVIAVICVMICSAEIGNLFVWMNYTDKTSVSPAEASYEKAGLTVVWAISSFIMIWTGMKYRYKPLRITALVLFGITLVKLFMFDIRDITPGGKILAFILLGALLLIISFMYQRLKKIIIDDSKDLM
jgi:hypothetical protein